MNLINFQCGDALNDITAYSCAESFGSRINVLFIGKDGVDFGFAGLTGGSFSSIAPTVSELQAALTATGDSHLVRLGHITNGLREKSSSTEISGLDTETGGSEEFDVIMSLNGSIKSLNNEVIETVMQYSQYVTLRVWAVDNKGWIWGGLTGYKVSSRGKFTPPLFDGTVARVDFSLSYNTDLVSDKAVQDAQYLTIDN